MKTLILNDKEVPFFDFNKIGKYDCIFIIGISQIGKTTLCQQIIQHIYPNEIGIIVSPTNMHEYKDLFKYAIVRKKTTYVDSYQNCNYIVYDDCIDMSSFHLLENIIKENNMLRIVALQFPYSIPCEILKDINYFFIFIPHMHITSKTRINYYTDNQLDISEGIALLTNHNCLVYEKDKVSYYNCITNDNTNDIDYSVKVGNTDTVIITDYLEKLKE